MLQLPAGNATDKDIPTGHRDSKPTVLRTAHTNGNKQTEVPGDVQTAVHKQYPGAPQAVTLRKPISQEQPRDQRCQGAGRLFLPAGNGQIPINRRQLFPTVQIVPK